MGAEVGACFSCLRSLMRVRLSLFQGFIGDRVRVRVRVWDRARARAEARALECTSIVVSCPVDFVCAYSVPSSSILDRAKP